MPGTSPRTYLITTFRDKERVKALGARWDPAEKRWYVPGHQDITSFAQWLPDLAAADAPIAAAESREVAQTAASTSGISLTQLLDGVAAAVAAAIPQPVWVRAEVVNASVTGGSGHVYLELTGRAPTAGCWHRRGPLSGEPRLMQYSPLSKRPPAWCSGLGSSC